MKVRNWLPPVFRWYTTYSNCKEALMKWTILLILSLVTSCFTPTAGRDFNQNDLSRIKRCQTNRSEVLSILGKPFNEGMQNGYKTMQWQYASASFSEQISKHAIVFLNNDDVVVDVALNPVGLIDITDNCQSRQKSSTINPT